MEPIIDGLEPVDAEEQQLAFAAIYEWLQSLVIAWVFIILAFTFLGRQVGVVGPSMIPTLNDGDRTIISKLFYAPKYKDVVVLTKPEFSEDSIVKRIIATEGQTVDIDYVTGTVIVDGVVLDEPYINERMREPYYETLEFPLTVPDNHVFVMGDNRNHSTDGRDPRIGLVNQDCILGKVYAIHWPLKDFRIFT